MEGVSSQLAPKCWYGFILTPQADANRQAIAWLPSIVEIHGDSSCTCGANQTQIANLVIAEGTAVGCAVRSNDHGTPVHVHIPTGISSSDVVAHLLQGSPKHESMD